MSHKAVSGLGVTVRINKSLLAALTTHRFKIESGKWSVALDYLHIYSNEAQQILEEQASNKKSPLAKFILTSPDGKKYFGMGKAVTVHIQNPFDDAIKVQTTFVGKGDLIIVD